MTSLRIGVVGSVAACVAIATVAAMQPAHAAPDYGGKLLTAPEAKSLTKFSGPLEAAPDFPSGKGSWMRFFTETGEMTGMPRFSVIVQLYEKPKPPTKAELEESSRPTTSSPGKIEKPKCKVFENKPPRFTTVCWDARSVSGFSTITIAKKFSVTGMSTMMLGGSGSPAPTGTTPTEPIPTTPVPTTEPLPDPSLDAPTDTTDTVGSNVIPMLRAKVTEAMKAKVAAEAKSLRDGQYKKITTGQP